MSQRKSTSSCSAAQMYSLPLPVINRAELLLPYKSYVKEQCKQRFLKGLNIKIDDRYKTRNKELTAKLTKLDDALDKVHTVTEYDEEFLKIVNGRPFFHHIPLYKSLTTILNRRFRMVHEISHGKDTILNIDVNFRIEQKMYDATLQRFSKEAKAFDQFIMEDYKKSMKILDEGEKLNNKLETKVAELQSLADESFTITARLLGLDYKYNLQQKYGRFLYYLSPPMWRSNNREFARSVEIEAQGFDYGHSHDEDTFNSMFEKMRKEFCTSPVKPVLYFTHPYDLLEVFNGIEQQLLYHLCRETQLVPHVKLMKDSIKAIKQKMEDDSAVVTASIKKFKELLLLCEQQCAELKDQFSRILNGFFYEAVGTLDVLKFTYHLEFCYSKVSNEKLMNLDMISRARAIEVMYMDYAKKLDAIQSGTVREAMTKYMELNKRKVDKAKLAAKELRLFHRLERELLRAHNLLSEKDKVVNTPFKKFPKHKLKCELLKVQKHRKTIQSLNEAEIDYLTLFTDWTKNEDPALYLQSHNFDKERNSRDA